MQEESTGKPSAQPKLPPATEVRHSQSCAKRSGGKCNCVPAYRSKVYNAGTGKHVRSPTFTGRGALAALKSWRVDALHALGYGTLASGGPMKVSAAADALIAGMESGAIRNRSGDVYKPSAIRSYKTAFELRIKDAIGKKKLTDVRRPDLQSIVKTMQAEGCSASGIRNVMNAVKVLFRQAIEDEIVTVNPTADLKLPAVRGGRDRIANPAEMSKLLEALPREDRGDAVRPIYAAAFYAGLRRGELQALDAAADLDLAAGLLHVRHGWDQVDGPIEPKSQAALRRISVIPALRDELVEHRQRCGRTAGLFFGRSETRAFDPGDLNRRAARAWERTCQHCGKIRDDHDDDACEFEALDPITLHEARHTFASLLIDARVNPKAISTLMGHSSISITFDRYGHLMPGGEEEAGALLDEYLTRADTKSRLEQIEADDD